MPSRAGDRGHPRPGRRAGARRPCRRLDEVGPPVEVDGARDVARRVDRRARAVGSPADVEDPDPGPACRCSASQSVVARSSGRARPLIVGIIRPWSPRSCPTRSKLAAVRDGAPGAGGRDLPQHRARSAPSRPRPRRPWRRSPRGSSTTGRAHRRRLAGGPGADGRGARRRRGGPDARTSTAIALTHSTTDGMNATRPRSTGSPATAPSRPATSIPARSARCTRCATARASRSTFVDIGDGGDDARTLAAFEAAITPRHAARRRCRTCCGRPGPVLPVAAIAELAHARGALVVDRWRPGARARSRSTSTTRGADAYAVAGPEVAARPGGDGRARGPARAIAAAHAGVRRAGSASRRSTRWARPTSSPMPAGSRARTSTGRRSWAWRARSRWLSMYVGLDWVYARGAAIARRAADAAGRRSRASRSSRRSTRWRRS